MLLKIFSNNFYDCLNWYVKMLIKKLLVTVGVLKETKE